MMPPPRPFRVTRCTIRDRDELVQVLRLVDAALQVRRDDDGVAAMRVVYDALVTYEPSIAAVRDELHNAASWGAAYHRLQLGEFPSVPASSLRADAGFVDSLLWNALAWTGIEVSYRLEPRISALGDYCVKVGYYVAHHGPSGTSALEAELSSWSNEKAKALSDFTFQAYIDSQLVGEFWIDVDSAPHARSAMPIRPARSIEKVYDDLIFDIAWDDLNEALGRGRPRKTVHLANLAPVQWEPALTRQNLFFLPQPPESNEELAANLSSALSGRSNGNHVHESATAPEAFKAIPPLPPTWVPDAREPAAEEPRRPVQSGPLVIRPPAPIERQVPPLVMRPPPSVPQPEPAQSVSQQVAPIVMPPAPEPQAPEPPQAIVPPMTMAPPAESAPIAVTIVELPPAVSEPAPVDTIDLRPVVVPVPTIYDFPPPQRLDIPAGWYKDPRRRFDFRWWDGSRWTDVVSHDGTSLHDPLQAPHPTHSF